MGSYLVSKTMLLYSGSLYEIEQWDKDYDGDLWYYNTVKSDLADFNLPLNIRTNTSSDKILRVIAYAAYRTGLKDFVKGLAKEGILCYPDHLLLYESGIKANRHSDDSYLTTAERETKLERLKQLFGIDDETSVVINNWMIKVLCPEYITLYSKEQNCYKVCFIGEDIKNIKLSLNEFSIIGSSFFDKIEIAKNSGNLNSWEKCILTY